MLPTAYLTTNVNTYTSFLPNPALMNHSKYSDLLRPPSNGSRPSASQRGRQANPRARSVSPQRGRFPSTTPMSRSCSNTSHTSSRPQDGRTRPRGRRVGPLSKEQAEGAALTRQVGACDQCRRRRVKVSTLTIRTTRMHYTLRY